MSFLTPLTDFVRNARIVRNAIEYSSVLPDYFRSRRLAGENQAAFDAVHTCVMFIGIGRSGTTLIGSLLDAHPNMVIANQQTMLKYLRPRLCSRTQVFSLLLENSRNAAQTGRMGGGGYSYAVPGQWQGKFDVLEVIGDKSKSAQAVTWLTSKPVLLDRLVQVTKARVRMIHAIRNPFDTIATRSLRRGLSLERITREYFALCERLRRLIRQIEAPDVHDVGRIAIHLEDFIEDPQPQLTAVCRLLGVEAGSDYLQECAAIVHPRPHQSRRDVLWDRRLIADIQARLDAIPFLRRYSFDG